jgi:outer membrane protein assembly factor BamE (lipoprotein component of BamABCDE complex)
MRKSIVLLMLGSLLTSACAGPGLRRDCLERKQQVDRGATLAGSELQVGLTTQQVRALVGEPVEILAAREPRGLEAWKYYLFQDCQAQLGMTAPVTELIFLDGHLVKWRTYVK